MDFRSIYKNPVSYVSDFKTIFKLLYDNLLVEALCYKEFVKFITGNNEV